MVGISIPLPESCLEPATPKGATHPMAAAILLTVLQSLAQVRIKD